MGANSLNFKRIFVLSAIFVAGLLTLLRTAWVGDDAMISMRCALNFTHGYGPTYNIDERVQAFTHPLWFFLMSAGAWISHGDVAGATYVLSFLCSLGLLFWLLREKYLNFWGAAVGCTALILSKAWVDYATSGLENPLAHLLLVDAALLGLKEQGKWTWRTQAIFFLLVGCVYLTRPDLVVVFLPLAGLIFWQGRKAPRDVLGAFVLGMLPVILWTAFSIYYYGFPLANTVYAKLGCGIPLGERFLQGCRYFDDSILRDPVTIPMILMGCFATARLSRVHAALVAGVGLYLVSVLTAGGDFMSGRFFTAPLVLSVVLLASASWKKERWLLLWSFVLLLGCFTLHKTLLSPKSYDDWNLKSLNHGIADERGYYYPAFGLWTNGVPRTRAWDLPTHVEHVVRDGNLGYDGFHFGPAIHFFDTVALADPLLARLPAAYKTNWRVGHFVRCMPEGFVESLWQNQNCLRDPELRAYYELIRTATRAPLNAPERWEAIWKLNSGAVKLSPRLWREFRYAPIFPPHLVYHPTSSGTHSSP
jgi:arabinofuranosyltransferase